MRTDIAYELPHAPGVAFVISLVSFFLLSYSADPAAMRLPETADDAHVTAFEHAHGFDRPLVTQVADWLGRIVLEASPRPAG